MSSNRRMGLLYDSVSPNTGDIAIGIAAQQILASLGVEGIPVDPFTQQTTSPLIIGGAELIRTSGDDFYDRFKIPGHHILNAAGVWNNADNLDYLKEYAFVSARSSREAETLSKWVPDVQVVPCATTLLKSDKYEIKGIDFSEPVVGIHLAPHSIRVIEELVDIVDSIPHQKVFIPFTHYNGDASFMAQMPFNRERTVMLGKLSPLDLHSVFGQMTYSLTTSMHASIFSYSQGVPFVSIYQEKVLNYFSDRGLNDFVVSDGHHLSYALETLRNNPPELRNYLKQDQESVLNAFMKYASFPQKQTDVASFAIFQNNQKVSPKEEILISQSERVLNDHDSAMSIIETRRTIAIVERDLARNSLDKFYRSKWVKFGLFLRKTFKITKR